MFGWYLYTDPYYMAGTILVLAAAVLSLFVSHRVNSRYRKYSRISNHRGITGYRVAREILNSYELYDVDIKEIGGTLSDNFNPSSNTLSLSKGVYESNSIAAVAVAAHECGHAIRKKEEYGALTVRNLILPIANAGRYLGWIAIFIGLLIGHTDIAWIGFLLMLGILAFQLITLPVEFNASSRALRILDAYYLDYDEMESAKKMLSAAAMTYVAGMISTLMSMLRIFLLIFGRSRDS